MKKFSFLLILIILSGSLFSDNLVIYAGAGLLEPIEKIADIFENENKIMIDVFYAGSGQLYGKMNFTEECDVFIPGSQMFIQKAKADNFIEQSFPLIKHTPIMVVRQEKQSDIKNLNDVLQKNVTFALGDSKACAIGKLSSEFFAKLGVEDIVYEKTVVFTPTVNQLLNYLVLDRADVSIIWQDMLKDNQDIVPLVVPELSDFEKVVSVAKTTFSKKSAESDLFIKFIKSNRAKNIFIEAGFQIVE